VKEKALTLTLVHTHHREPAGIIIRLREGKADAVRQTVLTHEKLNAHNTFDEPKVVVPKTTEVKERGETIQCALPPASVVRLDVRVG
jgi:alpha-L-arabinofuranosidase